MLQFRTRTLLCLVLVLPLWASSVSAQVASIAQEMKARHEKKMETVENYVIETNLYTSYHRKVGYDDSTTYETSTQMKGSSRFFESFEGTPTTPASIEPAFFDRLGEHATYGGTERVNGVLSHVLRVRNPTALSDHAGTETRRMTLYVDVDEHVFTRIRTVVAPNDAAGRESEFTIDFTDYRTVKGLTLPFMMTLQADLGLSKEQRQQLEALQRKLEQMSQEQREQLKSMMGEQLEQLRKIGTGEPTTIEVQSVRVNEGLPAGVFEDSTTNR